MPREMRKRVIDVPRFPVRTRLVETEEGGEWLPRLGFLEHQGRLGWRMTWAELLLKYGPVAVTIPARPPRPEVHHLKPNGASTVEDLLKHGETANGLAAHLASECMQDNLGDQQTVRDMHDIIGALANVQAAFHLLENRLRDGRATTKPGTWAVPVIPADVVKVKDSFGDTWTRGDGGGPTMWHCYDRVPVSVTEEELITDFGPIEEVSDGTA